MMFIVWAKHYNKDFLSVVVQSLSWTRIFVTPWTAAHEASLYFTTLQSLLKLMSVKSVMAFNHLILCHPLLLPSIFPSMGLFQWVGSSNQIPIKYWNFSFSISPSNEYSGLISFGIDWFDLLAIQRTIKYSPTPQFKSISSSALSFLYCPTLTSMNDYWKNHSFD